MLTIQGEYYFTLIEQTNAVYVLDKINQYRVANYLFD